MPKATKKSTTHQYLHTVTPLSKTLAIILFIALPIIAFFWGRAYEKIMEANTSQAAVNITPAYLSSPQVPSVDDSSTGY